MPTADECIRVAGELRELAGAEPSWPGGRRTAFEEPGGMVRADSTAVGLIPLVSQRVGAPQLEGLPRLRIVANYGVGHDNVDLAAAAARGIVVTNTPDVLTAATADLAMGLVLAASRRLREGLDLARSGEWRGWHPTQLLGMGLEGKVLGVVGAGRIGTATARRAAAFGMAVVYWDRAASPEIEAEVGARRMKTLAELLGAADVVSIHLPLSDETEGLIGGNELAAMRRVAVLVNTARGAIVDQEALIDALRSGRLAAAGLDVFADEPEIPGALRELPNVFLLPHLGSATREARHAMWALAAENVRAVLTGNAPLTPVSAGR